MEYTFIDWWFTKHWIASTIFTPAMTLAWACYKGLVVRGIIAFLMMGSLVVKKNYVGLRVGRG